MYNSCALEEYDRTRSRYLFSNFSIFLCYKIINIFTRHLQVSNIPLFFLSIINTDKDQDQDQDQDLDLDQF